MNHVPITVSTFYSFTPIAQPQVLRAPILAQMQALGIRGTITLASEGINATIAGAASAIDALMGFLRAQMDFTTPTYRTHQTPTQPFQRSKVKVKRELISLGLPAHPAQCVGNYVQPEQWNALITTPGVLLIDTRNDYEFALGHFTGAINPGTRNFKDMVVFTEQLVKPRLQASATGELKVAMYCTGGIRCDKYSSYLVAQGITEVYHLHGGILAYLEAIPKAESLWQGTCFVFDERVSV